MKIKGISQTFLEGEALEKEHEIEVSWCELEGKVISRTVYEEGYVTLVTNESEYFRVRGFEVSHSSPEGWEYFSTESRLFYVKNFGE